MRPFLLVVLALSAAACGGPKAATPPIAEHAHPMQCAPLPPPVETITIAEPKPGELHEVFELADTPELWEPSPEDETAAKYRAALAPRLGDLSPRGLLERSHRIIGASSRASESGNAVPVLAGKAGTIRKPGCLERQLFAKQAALYPLIEHPTEFGAFILRGSGRVRVYFSSQDMVGQKIRPQVVERVIADGKQGFRVVAHLHSHPFLLDRKPGDRMWTSADIVDDVAGALAPSFADAGLWIDGEAPIEEGWITNGMDSNHVPRASFVLFKKHDDEPK